VSDSGENWVEVASLKELTRRKKKLVTVGDQDIALFFVDDQVYALRDVCIHKERRLHKGVILKGRVICPGHQWAFDLPTGWVDEQGQCQPTYAVKVDGNAVFVDPEPRVRTDAPDHSERWQPA
jgi:nitrite reductase/ring-hydroxylating ferredoxin subunit